MRPRVLVVVGSQTQALLFRHLLDQQGVEALCVDGVAAAIDRMTAEPPAAMLVDATSLGPNAVAELRHHSDAPILAIGQTPLPMAGDIRRADGGDPQATARALKELLARNAEPPPTASPPSPAEIMRRSTVLVVDDSVTYREFVRLEFESEGCKVQVARNAEEAEAILLAGGFDCVLLDLVMPGTNGLQLCRRFDQYRRAHRLFFPIVMLTSQESDTQFVAALEAGADHFVGKSRPMEILKVKLMALLRTKFFLEDTLRAADAPLR